MSVRILHLADLHIGYEPRYLEEEKAALRREDFRDAFKRAVDYAVDGGNHINAVLIAGDLFDTHRPSDSDRGFVRGQLERLSSVSLPVLVVPGTHDSVGLPGSVYLAETFPRGVHVLSKPFPEAPLELELSGEKFNFYWLTYVPEQKKGVAEYLAQLQVPARGYHVFITHASVVGSPEWEVRRKDLPVSREELLSGNVHYVALGHYHNFFSFESRETLVVYPGTLEGKSFGENGERHLLTAVFEDGRVRVERRPFNRRTLKEESLSLDSEAVSSEGELLERIRSLGGEDLLLKLTLTGSPDFPVRADYLTAALTDDFFHLEIEDETSVLSSALAETVLEEKTIRGMFVRRLREEMLSAPEAERGVYELALKEGLSAFSERGVGPPSRSE